MELSRQPVRGAAVEAAPPVPSPAPAEAESEVRPELPAGDGPVAYQELLGTYLGTELYEAVAGLLTREKLGSAANGAVNAAFDWLAKQPAPSRVDPAVITALVGLLRQEVDARVGPWVEEHGAELSGKLTGWAGAHPRTVVAVALSAAVAAVVADVDLPTLQKKFALGGATVDVQAQLGSIRNLALREMRVALEASSGSLVLAHNDGATTVEGKLGDDKRKIETSGRFDGNDLVIERVGGLWTSDSGGTKVAAEATRGEQKWDGKVTVTDVSGDARTTNTGSYDTATGTLSLSRVRSTEDGEVRGAIANGPDGLSSEVSGSWRRGGTSVDGALASGPSGVSGSVGGSWSNDTTTLSGRLAGGPDGTKLDLSGAYRREGLMAELKAAIVSRGDSNVSGRVQRGNHTASADVTFGLDERVLREVGVSYGFQDPEGFRKFLVEARRKFDVDETTFRVLAQDKINDIYLRLSASATKREDRFGYDATAQAARHVSADTALIGGLRGVRDDVTGQSSLRPQIGVQYKGVPVIVEYDTATKRVGVSLGIKF